MRTAVRRCGGRRPIARRLVLRLGHGQSVPHDAAEGAIGARQTGSALRSLRDQEMDVFLAACQGLGLALAAGIVVAAVLGLPLAGRSPAAAFLAILIAAGVGALGFAWSLEEETSTWWPGIAGGALAGATAARLGMAVLSGAAERAREATSTLALVATGSGLVLGALSLLVSPVSLPAAAGLLVLYAGRRRRDARKYEGLRTLR